MQFDSLASALAMGGYGLYVWLAFGVSLLCLLGLALYTRRQRAQLLNNIAKEAQRRARIQASKEEKIHASQT